MTMLLVLAFVAIGILTLIVFGLLRTHADIIRALDRAGISLDSEAGSATASTMTTPSSAPTSSIVGTVPGGGPVSVALGGAQHTLLAFLSSNCTTCAGFWADLTSPTLSIGEHAVRLVIVAQDLAYESEANLVELAPAGVRTVCSSSAWDDYGVGGSPYFVLVDGRDAKIVGSGTATSWPQVRRFLTEALANFNNPNPTTHRKSATNENPTTHRKSATNTNPTTHRNSTNNGNPATLHKRGR